MDVLEDFAGSETLGLGLDTSPKGGPDLFGNAERFGAGGRTRTDMSLTSPDFESGAYTNFATPAGDRGGR